MWSGSVVHDAANTSGLGTGDAGRSSPSTPASTRSGSARPSRSRGALDDGRTWTPYAGNPVLDIGSTAFRDPKVLRHDDGWLMVLVLADERTVELYRSPDLLHWEHASSFGPAGSVEGVWECPDLLRVPVEGTDDVGRRAARERPRRRPGRRVRDAVLRRRAARRRVPGDPGRAVAGPRRRLLRRRLLLRRARTGAGRAGLDEQLAVRQRRAGHRLPGLDDAGATPVAAAARRPPRARPAPGRTRRGGRARGDRRGARRAHVVLPVAAPVLPRRRGGRPRHGRPVRAARPGRRRRAHRRSWWTSAPARSGSTGPGRARPTSTPDFAAVHTAPLPAPRPDDDGSGSRSWWTSRRWRCSSATARWSSPTWSSPVPRATGWRSSPRAAPRCCAACRRGLTPDAPRPRERCAPGASAFDDQSERRSPVSVSKTCTCCGSVVT